MAPGGYSAAEATVCVSVSVPTLFLLHDSRRCICGLRLNAKAISYRISREASAFFLPLSNQYIDVRAYKDKFNFCQKWTTTMMVADFGERPL